MPLSSRTVRRGTYSIVARDPATGELGVAVQSHWFGVGAVVSWTRAGVGAVATQSIAEAAYGPRALERLAAGESPRAALDALLAADELAPVRQVAVLGTQGPPAVHTGPGCIAHAGQVIGEDFSCQANMMVAATVPAAMAEAYRSAGGDLTERLLAALDAAQAEGGDVRGQQSAALVVAPATGAPWDVTHDVRVEDHPRPLEELRRLVTLARAYALGELGDSLLGAGRHEEAAAAYARASELAPHADELRFWAGLGIAETDLDAGLEQIRAAAAVKEGWLTLLDRLPADLAPAAPAVRRALGRDRA
jgi:uncharacterized Ntn-hydrolase superfamily protein